MKENRDILDSAELRKMPFKVPEGYFEQLQQRSEEIASSDRKAAPTLLGRLAPYAALAASFLILVVGGTFVLRHSSSSKVEVDPAAYYEEMYASAGEMTEEDIVEYLIWSGASVEEFSDLLDQQ